MSGDERDLELAALVRLGLASRLGRVREPAPGASLVDALVGAGALEPIQAEAVRSLVARHATTCACGRRTLAPLETGTFSCAACGQRLARASTDEAWTPGPAAPAAPRVGARIGPLELVEVLGEGAFGTVYRARHATLGRVSAVKVLPGAALDPRRRARFEREVEALARLRHPAIVGVHAAYEREGALVFEMDLVEGETLAERVARDGPLAWRDAARLVARVADAVEHAHAAGVLHRDLKPANVLVRREDGAPFVTDFGLARLLDQASSLTAASALMGTPVYMPPEAFEGVNGTAGDVYALGAILYEALAGRPPFREPTLLALFDKVARGAVEPTAAPGAPPALEAVRARAMAPASGARYPSAGALARDLRRLLDGEPIARPRRGRGALVSLAVALAALVVALGALEAPPPDRGGSTRPARADDLEAARRRVAARRRAGAPLEASDLAALGGVPAELEAAAAHALAHGLAGERALSTLRELAREHPGSRALSTLRGLAICDGGEATARAEAVAALRSGVGNHVRARRLGRALSTVDRLCEALDAGDRARLESPSWEALTRDLGADLPAIARESRASAAVVLGPLAAAARAAVRGRLLGDPLQPGPDRALVAALEAAARDDLPPHLRVLCAVLTEVDPATPSDGGPDEDPSGLARAADEVADDPLLAAAGLQIAATRAIARSGDAQSDAGAILDWLARSRARLRSLAASSASRTEADRFLEATVARRCQLGRGTLEERLARAAPSPTEAARHREAALESWRAALATSREDGTFAPQRVRDAMAVVRLLFELDRAPEARPLLHLIPQGDALEAELVRRTGDPARALEQARAASERRGGRADAWAVVALAEADLDHAEEARRAVAELARLEQREPPLLESLRSPAVAARVALRVGR